MLPNYFHYLYNIFNTLILIMWVNRHLKAILCKSSKKGPDEITAYIFTYRYTKFHSDIRKKMVLLKKNEEVHAILAEAPG